MDVEVIIDGEITITNARCIPADVMSVIRQENTFANPEYIAKARMGKSLFDTPKHLKAYRVADGNCVLPRGYGSRLSTVARDAGIYLRWEDRRIQAHTPFPAFFADGTRLRGAYQTAAVDRVVGTTQGVLVAPTGAGKTVMALDVIRRRGQRALILVHTKGLADQWREVIMSKLGIEAGMIGSGKWQPGPQITVGMLQTLKSRPEQARAFASTVGLVLVDECHHIPAVTFAEMIGLFPAYCRYGVTATPDRKDGLGQMITRLIGEPLAEIKPDQVEDAGGIVPAQIRVLNTRLQIDEVRTDEDGAWSKFLDAIATNVHRNRMIAEVAVEISRRHQVLVMADRVEHAETLATMIRGAVLVHGKLPAEVRKRAFASLSTARITVGTKGLLGEGIDVSTWSCLIMVSPIAGGSGLLQAVGRVIRPAPGKQAGIVIDVVDDHPFGRSTWRKRQRVYLDRGWPISTYTQQARTESPTASFSQGAGVLSNSTAGKTPPAQSCAAPDASPITPTPLTGSPTLALDIATHTGWAALRPDGTVVSGALDLTPRRSEGGGMMYLIFRRHLEGLLSAHAPQEVVFEEVNFNVSRQAAEIYHGLMATMRVVLEERRIPYRGIPVGAWKKQAFGHGGLGKEGIMEAVRDRGYDPKTQDEADALGVLVAAMRGA